LIATDASGNESRATANVQIIDAIPPYSTTKTIELLLNKEGKPLLDINTQGLNIYDACGLKSVTFSEQKLSCEVKSQNVSITAIDNNGNLSSFVTTVNLKDEIKPELKTKPVNLYLGKDGKATLVPQMMDNGSTDNCKIDSIYFSKSSFGCENVGKDSVTFYARDNYGNVSMKREAIMVIDSLMPSIITKEFTLTLDAQGKGEIKVEDIDNGTIDNCGIKTRALSKTIFDCNSLGKTEVIYTVEDNNGNKATKKLSITVIDNIKPTLKLKTNPSFSLDKDGFLKLNSNDIVAEAIDNCGIKQSTLSKESFSCANLGKSDIAVTTTDNSGNTTTAITSITITDGLGSCLCSYAMLASENIEIKGSTIAYGGIGTYQAQKTVSISKAIYGAINVFVKSDILTADTPPATVIKGIAPTPQSFEGNDKSTRKKLKVKNGKQGEFSDNDYGKVKVGKNATLTYTGMGEVYFKTLKIKKRGKLNFEQTAKVHIKTYTRLADEITINEGGEKVKIFATKNVGISKGSHVNAYVHSQASIAIEDADADNKTTINGLLTATKIKSGANVIIKGQPTDCSNTPAVAAQSDSLLVKANEAETEGEELLTVEPGANKISYGPNPATDYVNVIFLNPTGHERVKIIIRDSQGRQVRTQDSVIDSPKNHLQIDLKKLHSGLYLIELRTMNETSVVKLQVVK
jgi:hypothetical protein